MEAEMRTAPSNQVPSEELVSAVHAQCERALRRLRVLARERDDVLIGYALQSVERASAMSAPRRAL
jgi:BMFP domain-containing protein YqiC